MNFSIKKLTRQIIAFGEPLPSPSDDSVESVEVSLTQAQMNKLAQPGEKTLSEDGKTIAVTAPAVGAGDLPARPAPLFSDFTLSDTQHGKRAGGDLHSLATATVPGFMSPADKAKSDKQKYRAIITTDASGAATWTFPTPFPAGVVPVISMDVEAPANATVCYQAHISGTPTNTSVSVKAFKPTAATVKILALGDINLFTTPGVVRIHIYAEEPS